MKNENSFAQSAEKYLDKLKSSFKPLIIEQIEELAMALNISWKEGRQVFICGNGGSAANAIHIANDLHYGIGACGSKPIINGMRVEALPANQAIMTCLANDMNYDEVFSQQLTVRANPCDLLIVLSGSGNSPNVVNALITARKMKMQSFAILAYSGGKCKSLADHAIHFEINDMQIAEDTQLVVGHLCMQWLNSHKPNQVKPLNNG